MKRLIIYGLTIALVLSIVVVFAGCSSPVTPSGQVPGASFDSNGQRIYFTASSSSGEPISYTGSIRMMHTITCVNCHGPEGKGGTVYMMMQSFDVPNITWSHLTEEEHEEEGEHEEHPPYTEDTVKRAITQGLDPAGEPLDEFMPKWQMSSQDLDDLVDFMKTLQ
jgi:mono/diheme cytochrome c family protein